MNTVSERLRRNANMCTRVNTAVALLCESAHFGANEIDRLQKQRDELLSALINARELVQDWGHETDIEIQSTYNLAADLEKLDAIIAKSESAS